MKLKEKFDFAEGERKSGHKAAELKKKMKEYEDGIVPISDSTIIEMYMEYLKTKIYTKVSAPIDPNWTYVQKVKEPKPSVEDLLDQGYSLRQIQQIMKGEN